MGCAVRWRGWIKTSIRTTSLLVLVNGCATKEFGMRHEVPQGETLDHPYYLCFFTVILSGILLTVVGVYTIGLAGPPLKLLSVSWGFMVPLPTTCFVDTNSFLDVFLDSPCYFSDGCSSLVEVSSNSAAEPTNTDIVFSLVIADSTEDGCQPRRQGP
ncbi:hypothetical protein V6N13_009432 [Hibiscus sabdariffa]